MDWYNVGKDFILPGLAIFVSAIALYRTKVNIPDYAIIGRDGEILSRRGFKEYGLFVEKREEQLQENDRVPAYFLKFEKEPDYFEATTRVAAVPEIEQVGAKEYRVIFVASGFGNPIIECNFKVQAY